MRVGVIQSNYIPWRGYFDFINSVDLFVFHDDLQYTKNDWRNRNRVLGPAGPLWLTVPVKYRSVGMKIDEVPIDYSRDWPSRHLRQLESCYRQAAHYRRYADEFAEILRLRYASISELNITLSRWVMDKLGIQTPTLTSRQLGVTGRKSERLMQILKRVGGECYLSGPSAKAYLDLDLFEREGLRVEYKSYDYSPYCQLRPGFYGEVTVLDLLFNIGPEARRFLTSRSPNARATSDAPFSEAYLAPAAVYAQPV